MRRSNYTHCMQAINIQLVASLEAGARSAKFGVEADLCSLWATVVRTEASATVHFERSYGGWRYRRVSMRAFRALLDRVGGS